MNKTDKKNHKYADAADYLLKQITRANIIVLQNTKEFPDHWDIEEIEQALNIAGEYFATVAVMYRHDINGFSEKTLTDKLKEVFNETT